MNDLHFVSSGFINSKYKMCWLHGALYSYALMSRGYLREYKKIHNLVVLVDDAQEEVMAYNNLDLNINKLYNPTSISSRLVDDNIINSLKSKYGKFAVMVSRFSYPHKDQYTVANAFKKVVELYNDDINLVFVGDGPEEEKVKEMVSTFPDSIRKRIYFEGAHWDVQNYYSAAHILLHASVAGEGLPTIMLEAMAYDLPMVVTDSKTGPREILQDNQYGLLCRVQDADDMANKIHTLLNDDDLYKNYQKKGKSRLKDFAPECISIKINEILNNL